MTVRIQLDLLLTLPEQTDSNYNFARDPSDEASKALVRALENAALFMPYGTTLAPDAESWEGAVRDAMQQAEQIGDPAPHPPALVPDAKPEPAIQALAALEELEQAGEWFALVEQLEHRVGQTENADERVMLMLKLGALYEQQLCDNEQAVDAYRRVLDLDPNNDDALEALELNYARSEDWLRLLDILNRRVTRLDDDVERIVLLEQIALIYETIVEDSESARACYETILSIEPAHEEARLFLDALAP